MKKILSLFLVFSFSKSEDYKMPPKAIADIVDAEVSIVEVTPTYERMELTVVFLNSQ